MSVLCTLYRCNTPLNINCISAVIIFIYKRKLMSESLSFPNLPFHCCVPQQFLEIKKKERNKIVHGLLSHKDLSIFAGRPSLSFSDWTNQETNVALCTCYLSLLLLSLSIYFLARSSLLFSSPLSSPCNYPYIYNTSYNILLIASDCSRIAAFCATFEIVRIIPIKRTNYNSF